MSNILFVTFIYISVYIVGAQSSLQTVNGTINIRVGITSGCRDGRAFMPQIRKTYNKYRDHIKFNIVPWGRTRRNGDGNLTCQFGPNDCFANRLHRCSLHLLKENPDAQINYIECELTSPFPAFSQQSRHCAHAAGLESDDVENCLNTSGDQLEVPAQALSAEPMAVINFVPFIVFNDRVDHPLHAAAYRNLENIVCRALADDPSTGVTNCNKKYLDV